MKVVVTGANGFLGSWLSKRLAEEGHETYALVRKGSDLSELDGFQGKFVHGDVTDVTSLNDHFQNADAVFHLAGVIAYKPADRPLMDKVNIQGTRHVVQACLSQKVKKLVHLSSVVAVGAGFRPDEVLNENSHYNLKHLNLGYFETKRQAEEIVMQAVRENGLDAVALNPSTIYGAGDAKKGSRKTQIKVARGEFGMYPPGGVNVVAVEDVVEGVLRAWQGGRKGERYILASKNYLIRDVFRIIADEAGVQPPSLAVPKWFIRGTGHIGDLMNACGYSTSLSSETAWTSTLYHWFDSSKATRDLGLNFRSAEENIRKSVRWMKENGYLK